MCIMQIKTTIFVCVVYYHKHNPKVSPPPPLPPEHLSQYFIDPRVHETDNKPMKFRTFWYQHAIERLVPGYSAIARFQKIPYMTHGKPDRHNIRPRSYENIRDQPCTKIPKSYLALKCRISRWCHCLFYWPLGL